MMIKATELALDFEAIIGWPYPPKKENGQYSSGATDDRGKDPAFGIDCSGAFVRAYKKHGMGIAHGSNSIFRKHCDATGSINGDASRMYVGMAVFKRRDDGGEPDKYKGDGNGNMYHIGLVTRTNPLRIVHATPPVAKADTGLSNWTHYGWLADVDYDSVGVETPQTLSFGATFGATLLGSAQPAAATTAPAQAPQAGQAQVTGSGELRLRKQPSMSALIIKGMPPGTIVSVLERTSGWARVEYVDKYRMRHVGWCSDQYLTFGE